MKVLATCPFCKNGEDSLQHRLWCCPTLEQERQAWIPDDVQQWAKRGGKETLLANMCLGAREYPDEFPIEEE